MDLSIVIPAYEEANRLPNALPGLLAAVDARRTEIIVVDDGSSDDTASVARHWLSGLPHARVLRIAHRGKGAAVRAGVAHAAGDAVLYTDADMATDPEAIPRLVAALDTADVAIGSRAVAGSTTERAPLPRVVMGRGFNRLVRLATGLPWRDTQCGFKGFRAPVAHRLFDLSRVDGYAFDVELLALADSLGYRVVELPIQWRGVSGSHVRPLVDSARMIAGLAHAARHGRLPEPGSVAPVLPTSRA